MRLVFGKGKYSATVKEEILDSIAEDVVRGVYEKLPSNARTAEIIKYVIERAKELTDSIPVTYASHTNLEELLDGEQGNQTERD